MGTLVDLLKDVAAPVEREAAAGEFLFQQGDDARFVFAVAAGRVRLVRFTVEGERLTLFLAGAGDTFAEAALHSDRYHCAALCETDSRVLCFDTGRLSEGFLRNPQVLMRYTALLERQVRELRTLLELRSIRSAAERIFHYLRLRADRRTGIMTVTVPLKEIAQELGLAHETFYRALAALERDRAIERREKSIVIGGGPEQIIKG